MSINAESDAEGEGERGVCPDEGDGDKLISPSLPLPSNGNESDGGGKGELGNEARESDGDRLISPALL